MRLLGIIMSVSINSDLMCQSTINKIKLVYGCSFLNKGCSEKEMPQVLDQSETFFAAISTLIVHVLLESTAP